MSQKISSVDFSLLCNNGQQLVLDVRTHAEVDSESLSGSLHVPLQEFCANRVQQLVRDAKAGEDQPLYLLCGSGVRAEKAAAMLSGAISNPLWIIEGGINALKQTDVPIKAGERTHLSLERQVRIAAGALVLLGVVLGAVVAPAFYALSAFVGAGLMFAGITDTCGMAMLLARMPWNR